MAAPGYILVLLLAVCFSLATWLQPLAAAWEGSRAGAQNLIVLVMGDAQRLFAGLFFRKADVYFHSGYYPSVFDEARTNEMHIAEEAAGSEGASHLHEEHEEEGMGFLEPPRDWIEAMRRYSFNTEHTHLDENGKVGEMLPWLSISAELDPQNIETYTVAAYWLRGPMKRPKEAEEFLRVGQRANPENWEIPFVLGELYRDNKKDPIRARNFFELAARKLAAQEKNTGQSDLIAKRKIYIALSRLAESDGRIGDAVDCLQRLYDDVAPENKALRKELEKQLAELNSKLSK